MKDYSFFDDDHRLIVIKEASQSLCDEHSEELLNLINIIPYIHWEKQNLLSQAEDFYNNKWNYSYILFHEEKIIGILIAYFRRSDDVHIFDSLYIHRLAIDPNFQKRGIGTTVLKYFVQTSFAKIPWLLNISLQTNDEISNAHVIKLYKDIGFKAMYNVYYPNKKDILFLFERRFYSPFFKNIEPCSQLKLSHPRLKSVVWDLHSGKYLPALPVVYFSSTNKQKKEIVSFIFHNYNINVGFKTLPIELTEPQIEKADIENERKLVSFPLKNASRYIEYTPCIIEDTMLFIEYFNRADGAWELPGLDTKRWLRQLGQDGILDLLGNTEKRSAKFVSQTGAYTKKGKYYYGRGEIFGQIAWEKSIIKNPKYGTYPFFFHLIFIPDGADKTLAEMDMHEYAKYDYMRKSIIELIENISDNEKQMRLSSLFDSSCEEDSTK